MLILRLICVVYCVLITVLLLVPNPLALLGVRRIMVGYGGVGVHLLIFTLLAVIVLASRLPVGRLLLASLLLGYAITTELLQWLVPTRTVELRDMVENLLGLAAGSGLWWVAQRWPLRRTGDKESELPDGLS